MAYVTYKNRYSTNYRFTVDSIDDPEIANLKSMLVERNNSIKSARRGFPNCYWARQSTQGLSIRPRGPRDGNTHDTPIENATRFDVYIREYI